jgi:hypothetical protein
MDYCWALEYANRKNWYMQSSYIDMITVSYINRMVNAIQESADAYMLGAHNCPGKCRDCTALTKGTCGRKKRRYSMEALGKDCDYLHYMMFGEYKPWAYKGVSYVPMYMTRYAGWLDNTPWDDKEVHELMDMLLPLDKSYEASSVELVEWVDQVVDKYTPHTMTVEVPSGPHKGCQMWAYDLDGIKEAGV